MPRKYRMLTLKQFKRKLDGGFYVNGVGARRAIGKMKTWSTQDRMVARNWVTRRFGSPSPNSPHYKEGKRKGSVEVAEEAPVVSRVPALLKRYFALPYKVRLALLELLEASTEMGVDSCVTLLAILKDSEEALRRK